MLRARHEVVVERPLADVFAYLTDVRRLPEWQADVTETRVEGSGPVEAGTRFTEVRTFLGRRVESTIEVTELDPGRAFSVRTVAGPVPFAVRHTFAPADGGTRIVVEGGGDPGGVFRLAGPLVGRAAERAFRRDFGRLKAILEDRASS